MTVTAPGNTANSTLHDVETDFQIETVGLRAQAMARGRGMDADAMERLATIVTEVARNIVRHAGSGQIILRAIGEPGDGCMEVLGLDKGPGIADMTRVMREKYATPAGPVPESGLAVVRRSADMFDIYSQAGSGTALVAHVGCGAARTARRGSLQAMMRDSVGVVSVPLRGEEESGDGWAVRTANGRMTALVVDGLGHGPEAAIPARAALGIFNGATTETPETLVALMHDALHSTRGAALSMAVLDEKARLVRFCGVGNVEARVLTATGGRHFMPQNGIIGHTMAPALHPAGLPWPVQGRFVMHSDGISSRWTTDRYPGLLARHPVLLAGVLFRDFARARDDATVLVLRDPLAA